MGYKVMASTLPLLQKSLTERESSSSGRSSPCKTPLLRRLLICFVGTHDNGKTTLARDLELKILEMGIDVEVSPEVARIVAAEGYPINEETTFNTQLRIACKQLTQLQDYTRLARVVISDRFHDNAAYTQHASIQGRILQAEVEMIEDINWAMIHLFRDNMRLFYLEPLERENVTDDGLRSASLEYRDKIDEYIRNYNEYLRIPCTNVPPGTRKERLDFMLRELRDELRMLRDE